MGGQDLQSHAPNVGGDDGDQVCALNLSGQASLALLGLSDRRRHLVERDGEKFSDTRLTEVRLEEKVDDSTFDRP